MNWLHFGLLFLGALLLGIQVLHRLARETRLGILLSLGPLQGLALLELAANFAPYPEWPYLGWGFLGIALLLLLVPKPSADGTAESKLSRGWWIAFGVSLLVVVCYTQYFQMRYLDTDNWVHEPLIAFYMRGIWPPVTPYFPDIPLHGHFGRDLLMAVLTAPPADPLGTVWLVNLVCQGCAFAGLFFVGLRFTAKPLSALLGALMIFFGICVGSRTGMADTFDGNNGIVYAVLVLLFYHLAQVLEFDLEAEGLGRTRWQPTKWLVAGVTLGGYQAIYETTFGVLFLVGLTMATFFGRNRRIWLGLIVVAAIAFGLACTEGGPLTDMATRKSGGGEIQTQTSQNQGQHVSMHVPKAKFLQVLVTTADYQRMSTAFSTKLFAAFKPSLTGEGYMYIFDPRFLYAHWLPLFLSPLTLWTLWRRRAQLGLTMWFFGFWAYLIPAVVDFGPLYELEYFRWEYAAGWGFAGALGLSLGYWLERSYRHPATAPTKIMVWNRTSEGGLTVSMGPTLPRFAAALAVLIAAFASGEKLLNDAVIDAQRSRLKLIQSPTEWRLHLKDLGLSPADLQAMDWMAPQVVARQRVLSNLGGETPLGLWPDAVLAVRTGAITMGHDRPPEGSRQHAHPNYYRDALSRAFQANGRLDMLQAAGIQWVFLNPAALSDSAKETLGTGLPDKKVFRSGSEVRWVASIPPPVAAASSGEPTVEAHLDADAEELRGGHRYPLKLTLRNQRAEKIHVGWLRAQVDGQVPLDLRIDQDMEPGTSLEVEHSLVTPLGEGSSICKVSLVDSKLTLAEIPFNVDLKKRLADLRVRLDLPDAFERRHFYSLRVGLTSPLAIKAGQEFTISWRLRSPGGDYLWEMDSIPQPIDLDLQAGQEKEIFLQFLSPSDPGLYQPEIGLREKSTTETIQLPGEMGAVRVP